MLRTDRHGYSVVRRIKVMHIRDQKFLLVEGVPSMDNFQHVLEVRNLPTIEEWTLSNGGIYVLTSTQLGNCFLLGLTPVDLSRGAGAVTTPDGGSIPTSSTSRGLIAETPHLEMH